MRFEWYSSCGLFIGSLNLRPRKEINWPPCRSGIEDMIDIILSEFESSISAFRRMNKRQVRFKFIFIIIGAVSILQHEFTFSVRLYDVDGCRYIFQHKESFGCGFE